MPIQRLLMAFRPQLLYHSVTGFFIYLNQWAPKSELTLPDRSQDNTQTSTQRIVVLLTAPFFLLHLLLPLQLLLYFLQILLLENNLCFRLLQEHTHTSFLPCPHNQHHHTQLPLCSAFISNNSCAGQGEALKGQNQQQHSCWPFCRQLVLTHFLSMGMNIN